MDTPKTYFDLTTDELKMLLYFNKKYQAEADDIYEKIRWQQKIEFIEELLKTK